MKKSFEERFLAKVNKTETCWLWTGARHGSAKQGSYGNMRLGAKGGTAHRVSYEIYKGPIPDGMQVCHTCDVRLCVNPEHLFLGSATENMKDCIKKDRFSFPPIRIGINNPAAKLTEKQVREIKIRLETPYRGIITRLAQSYGVDRKTIPNIKNNIIWKHI